MSPGQTWAVLLVCMLLVALAGRLGRNTTEHSNLMRVRSGRKPRSNWTAGVILLLFVWGVVVMLWISLTR
jgi:hypothetical protein